MSTKRMPPRYSQGFWFVVPASLLHLIHTHMGFLPDTQDCGLRMRQECRIVSPPPTSKETASKRSGSAVMHVGIAKTITMCESFANCAGIITIYVTIIFCYIFTKLNWFWCKTILKGSAFTGTRLPYDALAIELQSFTYERYQIIILSPLYEPITLHCL